MCFYSLVPGSESELCQLTHGAPGAPNTDQCRNHARLVSGRALSGSLYTSGVKIQGNPLQLVCREHENPVAVTDLLSVRGTQGFLAGTHC